MFCNKLVEVFKSINEVVVAYFNEKIKIFYSIKIQAKIRLTSKYIIPSIMCQTFVAFLNVYLVFIMSKVLNKFTIITTIKRPINQFTYTKKSVKTNCYEMFIIIDGYEFYIIKYIIIH